MVWIFDERLPIYLQIADKIKWKIIGQELKAGEQLPTVRDLAMIVGANPNTVQRAFTSLENDGIVFSNRTAGRYVTKDADFISDLRHKIAQKELEKFLVQMKNIGFSEKEILEELNNYIKGD